MIIGCVLLYAANPQSLSFLHNSTSYQEDLHVCTDRTNENVTPHMHTIINSNIINFLILKFS